MLHVAMLLLLLASGLLAGCAAGRGEVYRPSSATAAPLAEARAACQHYALQAGRQAQPPQFGRQAGHPSQCAEYPNAVECRTDASRDALGAGQPQVALTTEGSRAHDAAYRRCMAAQGWQQQ